MEKAAPSLAVICPRHNGLDWIRQVSVLYEEAAPAPLSPFPVLKSADRLAWIGTLIGVVGAALLWTGAAFRGGVSGPAIVAACVCFAYAVACYGWAAARRASLWRVRRGMPRALSLWRAAWYCERCDVVFFPPSAPAAAVPAGAVPGQLMSPVEFQHLVWTAGGYARKAG